MSNIRIKDLEKSTLPYQLILTDGGGTPTYTSFSTSNVTEGTNFYFTDSRARNSISGGSGINYNPSTGIISIASTEPIFTLSPAYGITSLEITHWNTSYGWGNHASAGYTLDSTLLTKINYPIYSLKDSTSRISINWDTRIIKDSTNVLSINYQLRKLYNIVEVNTIDWNAGALYRADTTISISWQNSSLYDSNSVLSVNYIGRTLFNSSGVETLDWNGYTFFDSSLVISLNWDTRIISDTATVQSLNWDSRLLYNITGVKIMDWGYLNLIDSTSIISINWDTRILYGTTASPIATWASTNLFTIESTCFLNISDTYISSHIATTVQTPSTTHGIGNTVSGVLGVPTGWFEIKDSGGVTRAVPYY